MSRAVSIHIGVNQPRGRHAGRPLQYAEASAWRMAELAHQAGFGSILALRGRAATQQALHEALSAAAQTLESGDLLLLSFSGHGSRVRDCNRDEGFGWDETWCLADEEILDDKLAGYWRLFDAGVRIVVVAESCHGGGMGRDGDAVPAAAPPGHRAPVMRDGRRGGSEAVRGSRAEPELEAGPCIASPPADDLGIRASLLLISASTEDQTARDGLFTRYLLDVWNDGTFRGSYCDLYRRVRKHVMDEECSQEPQILMLGAPDLAFPLERAFRLGERAPVTRGAPVWS
jgi:hypothetical protein